MDKKLLILCSSFVLLFADSNILGKNQTSISNSNGIYTIDSTLKKGNNLFFTFDKFDLTSQEVAKFNDKGISNSIARIDSPLASSIDGEISSNANHLYLINPNGFIFGENAKLNLLGSLTITSADYLKFGDGSLLYSKPIENEILSSTSPISFGFLDSNKYSLVSISGKGKIIPDLLKSEDNRFKIAPNKELNIISGDIEIKDGSYLEGTRAGKDFEVRSATIKATNSDVNLISTHSAGEYNIADKSHNFIELGDINIKNRASIKLGDFTSENDSQTSNLFMLSKLFFMDNASISNGTKFLKNSKIEIYSNEVLLNSSNIIGTSFGDVSGSDIYIKGDILTLQGENLDPTFSYKGSFINTQATTTGKAGDIYINMNEITLKNSARVDTLSAGSNASGDAGDIKIECQDLNILGNSGILTISYIGAGGGIDIDISNRLYMQNSNILTSVYKENSNGGDITIKEPKYVILNSSKVKANTFEGRGGDISFKAKYFINSIDSNIEAKAISNRGVDGDINNDSLSVDISKLLTRDRFEFANEPYQLSSCSNRGSINSISINGRDSSYMRYDDLLPSQVGYY